MYYSNPSATEPAENDTYGRENVWDDNFVMVQHLQETPTGTTYDSTNNSNNGTTSEMYSANQVAGQIGKALDFDGSNDYVSVAENDSLNEFSSMTIGVWIKTISQSYGNEDNIVDRRDRNLGEYSYQICYDSASNELDFSIYTSATKAAKNSVLIEDENWHYISAVYNSTIGYVYLNNVLLPVTFNTTGIITQSDSPFVIGRRNGVHDAGLDYFNGQIDEVRISNTARSTHKRHKHGKPK